MGRELMEPVALPDEPDDGTRPGTPGAVPPAPDRARRRLRRRRWLLAVAGLLVVGLLGTQAVLDARDRDHVARLATVPGVVAPVDASIGVRWSTTDWSTIRSLADGTIGDLSIGAYMDESGERTARAVRTRTGQTVWSTVLSPAGPAARPTGPQLDPVCRVDATPQVVCLVPDAGPDGADGAATAATGPYLLVLDPATGRQLAQHEQAASSTGSFGLLDGLAVMASRSASDHLVVLAQRPLSGEVAWRFESAAPLAPPRPDAAQRDPSGLDLTVLAGHVAVTAAGGEAWVLTSRGDLVDEEGAGLRTAVQVLRGDRIAVVRYGLTTESSRSTRIVVGGGRLDAAADELPVPLQVDDGSAPNLLFTMSNQLVAWDLTTGREAWSSPVSISSGALLLSGRLVVRTSDGRLEAIDAASGATLWDVPLTATPDRSVATDGRSILAAEPAENGPRRLVAFAPDDGRRLWAAALPPTVTFVRPFGRQLIGATEDGRETFVLG